MKRIQVYGADWCEDTQRTRHHLDQMGLIYDYINIDHDDRAGEWVKAHNGGKQKTPTLEIDGDIISVPDDDQLDHILRAKAIIP